MKAESVYQDVTTRILAAMRRGCPPWRTPWEQADVSQPPRPAPLPLNIITNRPYSGVNTALLWATDFCSPYWGTERAWREAGACLRAGETPTVIYFSGAFERGGERHRFFRQYEVYNLDQVYGLDHLRGDAPYTEDYAPADEMIRNTKAVIRDDDKAWYDIGNDIVYRPPRTRFRQPATYYTTVFHELTHWTGNRQRLNRVFGRDKTTREYAAEELVAELGTCFLMARLEVPERMSELPHHAGYLKVWLRQIEEDSRAFFRAATAAQRAANFLMRFAVGVSNAKA